MYSSVFKQIISGDGLGLQRGGSSLNNKTFGEGELFLSFFFFVSREKVCLLSVQLSFPLNM